MLRSQSWRCPVFSGDLGDPDDDGLRERFQQRFGAQMTAPDLEERAANNGAHCLSFKW